LLKYEVGAMSEKMLEKRVCSRFNIPGATVRAKKPARLFRKGGYSPETFPLVDLSRGGIRFLTAKKLKLDRPIVLQLSIPTEDAPLTLHGHVRWYSTNQDQVFRYQFGVQLLPYGDVEGHNSPETLERIKALEQMYGDESLARDLQP
jgi:hypothetical protein